MSESSFHNTIIDVENLAIQPLKGAPIPCSALRVFSLSIEAHTEKGEKAALIFLNYWRSGSGGVDCGRASVLGQTPTQRS